VSIQIDSENKVSYIGAVSSSSKIRKNEKLGVATYIVYLSPHKSSGHGNTCSHATKGCISSCLYSSGRAKVFNKIGESRVKKTKFYFEQPERFAHHLCKEIENKHRLWTKKGYDFSVRINGTTDLSPENYAGINLLEKYENLTFYDYSKNPQRLELAKKYKNYHLTFSYSGDIGHNWKKAEEMLNNGVNVAVVFYPQIPKTFRGYGCIDGDISDLRYKDETSNIGKIVALKYKHVRGETKEDILNNPFIIKTQLNKLTNEYEV